ncbi:hypothetical protein J3A72_003631 [Stenotrophomonas sp. PvP093]|uniref:hypothetical protein n=1 Tax=Stenotrophomonas TaxID=40323 RepID=UPI0012B6E538|nr:hypothetical protein [Stenotrophomonas sp. PvP093]MBP2483339.1 hypothetical protein [Stenotrophomonas sp. PvP093]MCF3545422.1 hypothetical protein [Stenotrophomonas maltophilia]
MKDTLSQSPTSNVSAEIEQHALPFILPNQAYGENGITPINRDLHVHVQIIKGHELINQTSGRLATNHPGRLTQNPPPSLSNSNQMHQPGHLDYPAGYLGQKENQTASHSSQTKI